ncbi:unnamed protein product [Caenorhabditis nigoni]
MSATINQNLEEPKLGCLPVRETLITLSIVGLIGSCFVMPASLLGLALHCATLTGSYYYNDSLLNFCAKVYIFLIGLSGLAVVVAVYLLFANFSETWPLAVALFISAPCWLFVSYGHYVMIKRLRKYIEATDEPAKNPPV